MENRLSTLQPDCRVYLNDITGVAVVSGFNLEQVHIHACGVVRQGYVPVEDEYLLYEHKTTKQTGNFRKVTFIKKTL